MSIPIFISCDYCGAMRFCRRGDGWICDRCMSQMIEDQEVGRAIDVAGFDEDPDLILPGEGF